MITDDDNQRIIQIFEEREIENIVKEMKSLKAPGPYGMSGIFYKTYWNIIKEDFISSV